MSARLRNLNPYELHKYLVNVYCLNKKGSTAVLTRDTSRDRTDLDIIRENHKFLWEEDDVANTWEKQLAKKYYDKLFKEYCICDLSRYKENQVALRWRVENEVVLGKGQFQCGSKRCSNATGLRSWEVNFAYFEDGEKKNALVKLRTLKKSQKKKKKRIERESSSEKESEDDEAPSALQELDAVASTSTHPEETNESLWKKGVQEEVEKSREEEFAEYLEDLLL
ncbi:hypothetical protein MSG28_009705 [Choristoneura fumiferana]|uniref:Uncharacterized protein n=1 Tax=Choristoneura fumiferana TaxID=7141 RepID=A0ACC0JC78_CHOFU|nr:hypothetical protein MSG28_009705 [Choristoneura fumiferana]